MECKFIDADRHVTEPITLWEKHLEKEYHEFIPYAEDLNTNEKIATRIAKYGEVGATLLMPMMKIKDKPFFYQWSERAHIEASIQSKNVKHTIRKGTNPIDQLSSMDDTGVSEAMIFPTYASFIVNNENLPSKVSAAFATAYNTWLYEYCQADVKRLHPVGLLSRHDPKLLLKELHRVNSLGWKTIVLRPEKVNGRVLGHKDYELFWKTCEELNISVAFHGGTHFNLETAGTRHFTSHFAQHATSHPHEAQLAFLSLLESGVLERYPRLKFAFLEAGASWIPHWLWRLDEICYTQMPGELAHNIKQKPSEYFKRQCWVAFEIDEPCLSEVVEAIGNSRILYGTDFPHPDHLDFDIKDLKESNRGLSSADIEKALYSNPKEFFNI